MSEVSELSIENALTLTQTSGQSLTIPSIRTRRAETTVEIPSGGSLAMAGMIQEQTKQAMNGIPGMMELPILGTLFKSRDYVNRQTELMILVTPYVVRAVARKDLARPDDGFADASDPSAVLLGRFNRIYGVAKGDPATINPKAAYHGNYGFILD
jgi:pilus assembly protein CpaC